MFFKNSFFNKSFVSILTLSAIMASPDVLSAGRDNDNKNQPKGRPARQAFNFVAPTDPTLAFNFQAGHGLNNPAPPQFTFSAPIAPVQPETVLSAPDAPSVVEQDEKNNVEPTPAPQPKSLLRVQPRFDPTTAAPISVLSGQANKGDRQAQDQLIERNYWGFMDLSFQCSLWGIADRNPSRLNPLVWEDIENRAIENDQYAYALIDAYAHELRWTYGQANKVPFPVKFPRLFKAVQEGAEAGDPNAQFSLGVMYLQLDPQHSGLPVSAHKVNLAFESIKKAAVQGHSLAMSALGQIAWWRGPQGRNDVEALRWFLSSKGNKVSQDALKKILTRPSKDPKSDVSFQQEIEALRLQLGATSLRSHAQVGIHDPKGHYYESDFAIPELATQYQTVVDVHEEALNILNSLQSVTPGFMITCVTLNERRDRKQMLYNQTQLPAVSVVEIDKQEYLVLGEKNVSIAAQFLDYLAKIDERFLLADDILKEDSKSYRNRLNKHLDKLKEIRLSCLKSKKEMIDTPSQINQVSLDEWTNRFKKQEANYENKKQLLTPMYEEIEQERESLSNIKESIKGLLKNAASRDQEFILEHPYLK